MKMVQIAKAFTEGKIEKRTFWQLMRDKLSTLVDYQELLNGNPSCNELKINKSGIILNFNNSSPSMGGGINILFDFSEVISRAEAILSMGGDYEQEDFNFLTENINDDDVIFDVGGNVGLFSLVIANACPKSKIYSFEPLPTTYQKMMNNLNLNEKLKENIQTFNIGFSSEEGTFDFYLPGTDQAASMKPVNDEFYLLESDQRGNYTGKNRIEVVKCKVDTIDNFCRQHSIEKINILKLDIEGGEKDALLGANETLKKFNPIVYSEMLRKHSARFNYHPNEIINYMNDLGYDCFTFHNHKFTKINQMNDDTMETNFFFLNRDKHADKIKKYVEV